jgi:transcription elongation factor GreA
MDDKKEYLTKEKFEELTKKLEELKTVKRKEVAESLEYAKSLGDLSENGYYKAAKFRLGAIDRRIRMVTHLLKSAHIPAVVSKDTIDIGCRVIINDGEETKQYLMVGGYESNPLEGKLSVISPIGRMLVGKKAKDIIHVETPNGRKTITILTLAYT